MKTQPLAAGSGRKLKRSSSAYLDLERLSQLLENDLDNRSQLPEVAHNPAVSIVS